MKFASLETKFRIPTLCLLVSALVIILFPAYAFADSAGPSITSVFPSDGAVMKSGTLTITAEVVDADSVKYNSVTMLVDGNFVSPIKQYGWLDEYNDDYTTLNIYYSSQLIEGTHTVSLTVSDNLGNTSTREWQFSVSQPPAIYPVQPKKDAFVSELRPLISASVIDNTAVDPASVELYLDGVKKDASFDAGAGVVHYTPSKELTNESWHTVVVKARDLSGSPAEVTWTFFVNTFGEMTYPLDDSTCQQCHQRSSHPMNNCGTCHGANTSTTQPAYPLDDCYKCHYGASTYPATYHSDGLPYKEPPETHTAQDTDSCIECHGKSWSAGIPPLHNVTSTSERHMTSSQGCTTCHAGSLTREHVHRYDDSGQQLTCFTCHNSPDPNVRKAIADKNSSCNACHTGLDAGGGHPQHQNGLDAACQTCHSNAVLTEQQFHQNAGCGTCHNASSNEVVKYAINSKNTECTACHTEGHNINLIAKEPEDLPKYPGFKWSVPQPVSLMVGESWVPQEYIGVGAKIFISSRRSDLSAAELFDWYTTKMTELGWEKTGGTEAPASYMVLSYQKGARLATVIIYKGEYHSLDAPEVGFRIELLYN